MPFDEPRGSTGSFAAAAAEEEEEEEEEEARAEPVSCLE
jgi:hypothetical protein